MQSHIRIVEYEGQDQMVRKITEVYQEAMLEDARFVLELGPDHSDASLVIEDGNFSIEAPGVNTLISHNKILELRDVLDTAIRLGLTGEN